MADASAVFLNTVRGALVVAEAELSGKDGQINHMSEALDDIKGLLAPVSVRHFNNRTGFKHILGDYFPMFQRQAMDWLKTFQRRMSPRCSVKHAWQVVVEEKLHRELFQILEAIVSRTHFGVIADRTRKNCVFAFISHDRVRKVFSDCTDQNLNKNTFLKRRIKGNKRVEAIISSEKQFGIKYSYRKELITIDFHTATGMSMTGLSMCEMNSNYDLSFQSNTFNILVFI